MAKASAAADKAPAPRKKRGIKKGEARVVRLTPEKERFCLEYVAGVHRGNAARCYLDSHPQSEANMASAAWAGCKLLKEPAVQTFMAEIATVVDAKLAHEYDATIDRIARELCAVGFSDPIEAIGRNNSILDIAQMPESMRRAVQSVKVKTFNPGTGDAEPWETVEIKFWPKVEALRTLAQWRGMLISKSEVGKPGDFANMTDEQLDAEIAALETRDAIAKARKSANAKLAAKRDTARAKAADGGD